MAQAPLSEAAAREIAEAVGARGSMSAAAAALGIPVTTAKSRYGRAVQMGLAMPLQPRHGRPVGRHDEADEKPLTYESALLEWRRYIGQADARAVTPPKRKPGTRKRYVIAGDFHIPFHDKAYVAELFRREKHADALVISGDLQDFYSVSRFTKYEDVPIERELAEVQLFLEQAAATWPEVIIIAGNHDHQRFEKRLREHLDAEMVKVVTFLAGGNLSPIALIAKQFPNVKIAGADVGRHHLSWMTQIGDVIVSHAEKFSVTPGAALRKVDEWLLDREQNLNLAPWKLLIQAHTHQLGWFPFHADKLLIEGGCLCEHHGYQFTAKIGGRPQRRGWVSLEQVDGVTDISTVKLTWLDAEGRRAA